MTQDKIEELSLSLDKLNSGQSPAAGDAETAELLAVAALLKRADLPVSPPPHILAATVRSAAEGMKAARSRRNKWMYSGLLGAAASLLIFLGLNGLPDWQASTTAPAQPPSPQQVQTINPQTDPAPAPASSVQNPRTATEAALTSETATAPASADRPPAIPSNVFSSAPPEKAPSPASNPPAAGEAQPAASPKLAARMAPPAEDAAPLKPLRIPGRTPDSISTDAASGSLKQIFAAGTPQELIVLQRRQIQNNQAVAPQTKAYASRDAIAAEKEAASAINTLTVIRDGQEVTLSGRQSRQELLELSCQLELGP